MLSKRTFDNLKKIKKQNSERFVFKTDSPVYLDLRGTQLNWDKKEIFYYERLSSIVRGLVFAMMEKRHSGHPGGSSSKVEQFLALTLGGSLKFDLLNPKYSGRDRLVWSAGHCTPLLYSGLAVFFEVLRRGGRKFSSAVVKAVFPEDLLNFRHTDGLPGHAESDYPLSDFSTGPSGHGFSAAGGLSILHKSVGLKTNIRVLMGDAESEEGITYEARNLLSAVGADNMVVSLDRNGFGIDGSTDEVMSRDYVNYWLGMGWNVLEVNGHDFSELLTAYELADNGWGNKLPTVVICHTVKGFAYGKLSGTAKSHGEALEKLDYIKAMKDLGFEASGGDSVAKDIKNILDFLDKDLESFIHKKISKSASKLKPESVLVDLIRKANSKRPLISPVEIKKPKKLPQEMSFKSGEKFSMRESAGNWFEWIMKQSAFFYAGAGDVSGSVMTSPAEKVYGIFNKKNPRGRGVRFGIAEQNMAMMSSALSQDVLPGGFTPSAVFGTYAVFSDIVANMIRLSLFDAKVRGKKGFFVFLATHAGPDTGEDGPTHQGIFWQSLYKTFPGIKVYEPLDAVETIEMLFYALKQKEPIVLTLPRVSTMVFDRKKYAPVKNTLQGAYIFKDYENNRLPKKTLMVAGAKMLENVLLAVESLENKFNIKIIAVSSPELFLEWQKKNPQLANQVLTDEEKKRVIVFNSCTNEFLDDLILTNNVREKMFGAEKFLSSGTADEVYEQAGFSVDQIKEKILRLI